MRRNIIQITADDSPNIEFAKKQIEQGKVPDDTVVMPGVLTYGEFLHRMATWDEDRIKVGLRAEFDDGPLMMLYPKSWLDRAGLMAAYLDELVALGSLKRRALAAGMDPGEGSADTSVSIIDEFGLIKLISEKTPNTAKVTTLAMDLMSEYNIEPQNFLLDRGGGGKQHADRLRQYGIAVRTIFFGAPPTIEPRRLPNTLSERKEVLEERHAYLNLRAEMFWDLRTLLDPEGDPYDQASDTKQTFAIPFAQYPALLEQMRPIPLTRDEYDRLYIIPKTRKDSSLSGEANEGKVKTLMQIIGRSPDDLDSLVLAIHGLLHKPRHGKAGVH